ncbi:polyphosphoinositide phosphatase isoform X2 [Trichogramma pretiosum]|uniref:polyphosphoinositide phosphatase isoform X2 n=1 Tax=Trichogramma pretiosum TaxID=7493 RepID=UPI0006C9B644|nr:polyphosphoinositide phosphatase isoform X2 [Trichogramma pretiosum]
MLLSKCNLSSIQKIALYETKNSFYLIGSNVTLTSFRVLRIVRSEPKELNIINDEKEYTQQEVREMVKAIDSEGNDTSRKHGVSNITKIVSAFGIIGFVRFLEGYYIVVVTKRRRVAVIGHHTIYKVEDSSMIYIPNESVRIFHPDEQRYVKMFQSIDLSSNFYFSYSYDLTSTLQINVNRSEGFEKKPHRRFIWNSHLLKKFQDTIHPSWLLFFIHGFVGQSNISIYGRSTYITLIARRSSKYAGTRFLKRGTNFNGDVANEVETEQIVHDCSSSTLSRECLSSFVQLRGSVPCHWSQDISKIVPKPTIAVDLSDPYVETAAAHFRDLLERYGAPIFILNLVKKREKKKHESLLSEELQSSVAYLNQFLSSNDAIHYINFDMARKNKSKKSNVISRLADIANYAIAKTGMFRSWTPNDDRSSEKATTKSLQTGIIRTNCVDCLDRTNTAQFSLGKCALGHQLHHLGLLEAPQLEFDTDCVRMLEELYEDHGDTLALQYGGSQLVHRVKTYRKTAPWTSQGNDIMQTLSRYYSNTFSDQEKQQAINLFLGLFVPEEGRSPIWEVPTDYYIHHIETRIFKHNKKVISHWWGDGDNYKNPNDCTDQTEDDVKSQFDVYDDFYRPSELSLLSEVYGYQVSHSVRDFMPHFTTDFSPFSIRIRPGRRKEEAGYKNQTKNPSLSGHCSTQSSASSSGTSSDDEDSISRRSLTPVVKRDESKKIISKQFFQKTENVYGLEYKYPIKNLATYKRVASIAEKSQPVKLHKKSFKPTYEVEKGKIVLSPTSPKSFTLYSKFLNFGTELRKFNTNC